MTAFTPTPEQLSVISLDEGAYLVTAPPGSGKTMVLTQRTIRLLRDSFGESFRILALTFTTKAAEEMRDRIEAEVGQEWRRVQALTFHAFCLDVLQHYGERVGVGPNLTIYESDTDRLEVLTRGLSDDGYRIVLTPDTRRELGTALVEIGRLKRDLVPADAAPPELFVGIRLDEVYTAYDRTLRLFGAVDFDDLLLLTHRLLTEHQRVAAHYRRIYRYVMVDEAQDMTRAQYEVLAAFLGREHRNVLLVADADQSIYGFAGASHEFLERFTRDFGARQLPLHSNFRCARRIVLLANRLISHNPDRAGEAALGMNAATEAEGEAQGASFPTESREASAVADWVERVLARGLEPEWVEEGESTSVTDRDVCVLARSRYALRAVIDELEQRDVPYQFGTGEAGLFESAIFRATLHALRVLANPKDMMSRAKLLAALDLPDAVVDDLVEAPQASDFFEALRTDDGPWAVIGPKFAAVARGELKPVALVDALISLELEIHDDGERELSRLDQQVLAERWKTHSARMGNVERSLSGLLGDLSLAGRPAEGEGVRVLSIHAVKGLEFRVVLLVGMNDGVFPDFRATTSLALQEERRNAYVAVTRASRLLVLTRPRTRVTSYGNIRDQQESRFVGEMGLNMVSG
jgi:DNA helicase-2/ATP-dependent DNA helicase PcrA